MRSAEMAGAILSMAFAFVVVVTFTMLALGHSFALAWAEGWLFAFVALIIYSCALWRKTERRD